MTNRERRQRRVWIWTVDTFGSEVANDRSERARRFLEEALELAQACGLGPDDVKALTQRVFLKPPGNINREVGQVGVTLLALCEARLVSAEREEVREIERIFAIEREVWVDRQNAKAAVGLGKKVEP